MSTFTGSQVDMTNARSMSVAVWMQPVAYSYTDVDFDSDVWVCLDVDITALAKSLESHWWSLCVLNWWHWQSNFYLGIWIVQYCITALAKSLEAHWNHSVHEYTPRSSSAMVIVCIQLMTVTIQCGGVDAASSLFIHWCLLWLWCIGVPGRWHHHIGKVTWITLKPLAPWVYPKVELSNGRRVSSIDDSDDPMWRCGRSQ